jgi:HK97 family phage prohead protease
MSDTLTATGKTLTGYALTFNQESLDLGGFVERIAPDALDRTNSERPDIRALVGHDAQLLIGRTSSGTLRYTVDGKGLAVAIDPPNTQAGRDVTELVRRRDLTGMSFSFTTIVDDWTQQSGRVVRILRDISIREVSAVTWPAYPATTVTMGARAASACRHDEETVERWNLKSLQNLMWNTARVAQAKAVATGQTTCGICHKSPAVAVRSVVPMCAACLATGDRGRQRQFETATEQRHQPPGHHSKKWWTHWHRQQLAK